MKLILASKSGVRKEILQKYKIDFKAITDDQLDLLSDQINLCL